LNHVLDERRNIMQHSLKQLEPTKLDSFIQSFEKVASIAQTLEIKTISELSNEEE
jgi:hypothetical protein